MLTLSFILLLIAAVGGTCVVAYFACTDIWTWMLGGGDLFMACLSGIGNIIGAMIESLGS